jgi:hypothetical protein
MDDWEVGTPETINIQNNHLRKLAIELLDDDHGISQASWIHLNILLLELNSYRNADIIKAVTFTDLRFFLRKGHGLEP